MKVKNKRGPYWIEYHGISLQELYKNRSINL